MDLGAATDLVNGVRAMGPHVVITAARSTVYAFSPERNPAILSRAAKGNGHKRTTAARIRPRGFTHEPYETQVALGLKKGEGQWEQASAPSGPG